MKSLYFSHDHNASDDHKMLFLRQQLRMEGVGIYWYIIEQLHKAGGRLPLKMAPILATQMQTSEAKVLAVINDFELFITEEDEFYSQRLSEFIEKYMTVILKQSKGGRKGMEKRWNKPSTTTYNPDDFI